MPIDKIFAHVSCADLEASTGWYRDLFGRPPDAIPMAGLAEWRHGEAARLPLFEDASKAGRRTLTLIVSDLHGERVRLDAAGLAPGKVEPADTASLVRLRALDGNLVVLAQPGQA